ncbi:Mds3p NDAI_0B02740 [Naumovozyma dairenensis CBS 421]|uniref:Attractin/MKLN-like beta-propeller domain-containing protein n=1 Tax=Naumovozyma dairenensis (strain ATCC 10597 / BCRC 20456 / CBS 421 / NBRC 0211 / NRRL Y-12639) TaxID=1071378 RepID=G0W698_NAUDC|nr:hypothetical protein NDAI_0B02740 [Naumovozyma dairenensis CBS 421]CCD23309.1 hypothetical protein NDAI_0B02740 [Naumovozyma dairenensis CBS 421]
MPLLQPSTCTCYPLQLPTLTSNQKLLDEPTKKRISLECRTGAATILARSNIFVHGGLTIPLNLEGQINSLQLQKELILYFSKEKNNGISFENLNQWISSETFFLDLISRTWYRVETTLQKVDDNESNNNNNDDSNDNGNNIQKNIKSDNDNNDNNNDTNDVDDDDNDGNETYSEVGSTHIIIESQLKERLFHSICYSKSCLYIFGGLIVSPQNGYELIATNELWKLDLRTKTWILLSKDPRIARRFNHTMHVKNENNDKRDTKLVIVGGLNNLDQPIHKIDIFNITQNCWQSDSIPKDPLDVRSNIDGVDVSLNDDVNFTVLVDNNEAKIPALAYYSPNFQNVTSDTEDNLEGQGTIDSSGTENFSSPIVILPLITEAKGIRMDYNEAQTGSLLKRPFNLQYPTGDYFGYSIIIGGFYSGTNALDFYCFVYDIPSGKWTRLGIYCPDCDEYTHRFWKIFVWKSHHQAIMLGTKNDDSCSPTVQRFDYLSTFGLPIINVYNKALQPGLRNLLATPLPSSTKENETTEFNDDDQPFRKLSFTFSATSQFESYIHYIAPPLDKNIIKSVFPPYAMVLGKDALEIFGKPLSDFEFITSEGDSIGIPLYLLRRRWGRYFDMLLSRSYAQVCADYETTGNQSTLIKISSRNSKSGSKDFQTESRLSSSGSLENYFNRSSVQWPYTRKSSILGPTTNNLGTAGTKNTGTSEPSHISKGETPSKGTSTTETTAEEPRNYYRKEEDDDPISSYALTKNPTTESRYSQATTGSTTSSSGGMVFRVPFQEKNGTSSAQLRTQGYSSNDYEANPQKRRSSLLGIPDRDMLKVLSSDAHRRSSHPTLSYIERRNSSTVPQQSPLRVPTSTRSSISYVSSSSDRMGNPMNQSRAGSFTESPVLGVLNINLPPQASIPIDPLPPIPGHESKLPNGRRNNSIGDYFRNSNFPTRRNSLRRASTPDLVRPSDSLDASIDRQLLDEENEDERDSSSQRKSSFFPPRFGSGSKSIDTSRNSITDERGRLSVTSCTDSLNSRSSNVTLEVEPLLTPRSLYMPWPTATVRAFAEFFYTGQVNNKWMLAPVVLDLLVMAKIYEFPLLYNLVAEVLYSIVGRKEENLAVTCKALKETFENKVLIYCEGNSEKTKLFLRKNENFKELLRLKRCLENLDNGYFDIDLVRNASRTHSTSTFESNAADYLDKIMNRDSGISSSINYVPTAFAGGPRDSHNSVGSLGFPPSLNIQPGRQSVSGYAQRPKNKSSLSKEIDPTSFPEFNTNIGPLSGGFRKESAVDPKSNIPDYLNITDDISLSTTSSSSSSSSDYDDATEQESSTENKGPKIDSTKDSEMNSGEKETISRESNQLKDNFPKETRSDSDDYDSGLAMLSLNKMRRKVKKGEDHDDSIDPLFKTNNNTNIQSPKKNYGTFARYGSSLGSKAFRGEEPENDFSMLTLENLASRNSLPPVDYIIKSIYKTVVLVNDIRLMVRCLDCVEISKGLKVLKKKFSQEIQAIDKDIAAKNVTATTVAKENKEVPT